jgi:CRP-like cAMP-binding protein
VTNNEPNFLGLFAREGDVVTLKSGEKLFQRGDIAKHGYVLLEGELRIGEGNATLEQVSPGAMVGEMALVDHEPRSATVTALTDCKLARFDEKRFLFLVQQTPSFALNVIRLISHRLRRMNERVGG